MYPIKLPSSLQNKLIYAPHQSFVLFPLEMDQMNEPLIYASDPRKDSVENIHLKLAAVVFQRYLSF